MNYPPVIYKGYVIEIKETYSDYHYIIKKDNKVIVESAQGFPFPPEADIAAKMHINKMIGGQNGWILT